MLFEELSQPCQRDTYKFYKAKITTVEITIQGINNQLYSQGMRA